MNIVFNKLIAGNLFRSSKILNKLKLSRIAGILDKYSGWLVRYIWGKSLKINNNQILFISFNKQYSCNPKYICEELIKRNSGLDIIWLAEVDRQSCDGRFPSNIKRVYVGTKEAFEAILTSKIIVQNAYVSQEIGYVPKKRGQYYIQTWHGSLGIKKFGPGCDKIKSRINAAIRCGKMTDYFLSNSRFETEEVAPVFWRTAKTLEIGHARNDILFKSDNLDIIKKIRKSLLITGGTHIVLYAPTFRDNKEMDVYGLDYEGLITTLEKKMGGQWIILVKYHYSNRRTANQLENTGKIINVSKYVDIQELMLISDIGITDYSSWVFDFILTKRPVFLYAQDMHNYEQERGFYYPLSDTPFPIASTNKELWDNIENFNQKQYEINVNKFLQEKGCIEDGNASEKAVDLILQLSQKK